MEATHIKSNIRDGKLGMLNEDDEDDGISQLELYREEVHNLMFITWYSLNDDKKIPAGFLHVKKFIFMTQPHIIIQQ